VRAADVRAGLRVRITSLESTKSWLVKQPHLDCRRVDVTGTVKGAVPQHGRLVWWVEHDGSNEVGAYGFPEMAPLTPEEDPGPDHRSRGRWPRRPLGG